MPSGVMLLSSSSVASSAWSYAARSKRSGSSARPCQQRARRCTKARIFGSVNESSGGAHAEVLGHEQTDDNIFVFADVSADFEEEDVFAENERHLQGLSSSIEKPFTPCFEDVSTAHFRIADGVKMTRCEKSTKLSKLTGMDIFLKHEWEQATGSFKERGARNALLSLSEDKKKIGVVAASAGNHALALAYHGNELGIPVTVVMPTIAPLTKITLTRALGARVILEGDSIADAAAVGRQFVESDGLTYINGFDDYEIISGAGSVGLEILNQVKDVDAIVVPVGGGGLIAGIALAVKTLKPEVLIIGVEPERCASMCAAMRAGSAVRVEMGGPTLADGLAVPTVGPRSFEVVRPRLDKLVQVSERDISLAMLRLVETEKLVQEGAGIVGLAACLAGILPELEGKKVAVPLCGGNIDTSTLGACLDRGLVNDGRLIRFKCVVPDRPGGIAGLCATLAFVGASIKDMKHERAWLQEDSHSVEVEVTVELTGPDMLHALKKEISKKYTCMFDNQTTFGSSKILKKAFTSRAHIGEMEVQATVERKEEPVPKLAPEPVKAETVKTEEAPAPSLPPPRLFDFQSVTSAIKFTPEVVGSIENAFGMLAQGKVDVPLPMHIGIADTEKAGPGDCHIKGGYIEGTGTWTVKLANVSFYNNIANGLPAGSGIFVVCNAVNGAPLGIFQENRYLTDLRTGAAGAVAVKHFALPHHKTVAFVGAGVIAKNMARACAQIHGFEMGYVYARNPANSSKFAREMEKELGYSFMACASAEDAVRNADVIFTQTPGGATVLEADWLKEEVTIISSGSDQPTKQELPVDIMAKGKFVADLVRQCARVGELRSAIEAGVMTEDDVYAEIGEVVNGTKPGRQEGDGLIVVDLTGTGAQDAAIGQVAWDVLGN